jgi:glc operon protein GlcG
MRDDWDLEFVPRLLLATRVSLGAASALCRIARRAARDDGLAVSVVVVDGGGAIVAAERMDGAEALSVEIAAAKARSSSLCGLPTAAIGALAAGDEPGLVTVKGLVAVGGGVPLQHDNARVGAIGVSGASPAQDHAIAVAAAAALADLLKPALSD